MNPKLIGILIFSVMAFSACFAQGGKELPLGLKNVSTEKFTELLDQAKNNDDYVILDVRTKGEYEAARIEGAVVLDFYQPTFVDELEKLDKDKVYLIYCRSGNRSGQTLNIMADLNFTRVYNLLGGINRWYSENRPIVN